MKASHFQEYDIIILTIFIQPSKTTTTKEAKKQKTGSSQEKAVTGNCPEDTQTLDLLDKDSKQAILNMLKGLKEITPRINKSMRMTSQQSENINGTYFISRIKKHKSDFKNHQIGSNTRFMPAEGRNSKFEHRSVEIMQFEEQKENIF